MALTKIEVESRLFDGMARVLVFTGIDSNTITDATTLAQVMADAQDLGQIIADSGSWEGDDLEVNTLKNTEGGTVRSLSTAGTCAWSCRIPHSAETAKVAGGRTIATTSIGTDFTKGTGDVIGINPSRMVLSHPVAVLNLAHNELAIFPKGTVAFTPTFEDDGLVEYTVKATALDIETKTLDTMMFIPLGKDPFALADTK